MGLINKVDMVCLSMLVKNMFEIKQMKIVH